MADIIIYEVHFFFLFITIIIITLENVINPHCCFHSFFLGRLNVSMAYIWHTFLVVLFLSLFFDKSYQLRKKKNAQEQSLKFMELKMFVTCHRNPSPNVLASQAFTLVGLLSPRDFILKQISWNLIVCTCFNVASSCCSIKRADMPFHWRLPCSFLSS